MTEQEIIEGNELIAEFMGNTVKDDLWYMPNQSQYAFKGDFEYKMDAFYSKDLKYHSSWDWLMPVVEKIELIGYYTRIDNDYITICRFNDYSGLIAKSNTFTHKLGKIHGLRLAVVEFIKWYNLCQK